ncbi:deoxyribodipyrimidine photo-lyase [soil metagenome]
MRQKSDAVPGQHLVSKFSSMSYSVVWFKRDLRLHDHAALYHAAQRGPVLCLYVVEPAIWAAPDAANQHYQFILESLRELYTGLRQHGGRLFVVTGAVPAILERLFFLQPFSALYSHEETGNDISYQRDKEVGRWCLQHGVAWQQFMQFGVVRRLKNRDLWKSQWDQHIAAPSWPMPAMTFIDLPWQEPAPPAPAQLGLDSFQPPQRQPGGRRAGVAVLDSFLQQRSRTYRGGISSPLSAPTACSRLSPYLAYGCVSLREIVQATLSKMHALPALASGQKQGLSAFISRLYWHCHFIQKLESEPLIEYQNMHRGYDGMREADWNPAHFTALTEGRTGWPMVDACVVMLRETGWINFRMRAMLVSVAAYPLWLHWRECGQWLARQFLDYEPGIHWSQMQMQSGTTGINIPRVYNPVKQARDHDPYGHFVRRWLPAMRRVPDSWLFEPWRMPDDLQARYGVIVGQDIARPLVDLEVASRAAKARLFSLRAQPEIKAGKSAIVEKHASRKRSKATLPSSGKAKTISAKDSARPGPPTAHDTNAAPPASRQLSLEF